MLRKGEVGKMNSLGRGDVEPVSKLIRVLAWFIVLVGFAALAGAILFGVIIERDVRVVVLLVPFGVPMHAALSVAISGYAPRYLLFAHGPKTK